MERPVVPSSRPDAVASECDEPVGAEAVIEVSISPSL